MRGKAVVNRKALEGVGITPAYAGKSSFSCRGDSDY